MRFFLIIIVLVFMSCEKNKKDMMEIDSETKIEGTWKMIYAEIKEADSIQIKDFSNTEFIKIINRTHFAFFNQNLDDATQFYGGGGTYQLTDSIYIEKLEFTSVDEIRNHDFPFTIKIKNDTLIQYGTEEVKEANIKRDIVEKYIRIK